MPESDKDLHFSQCGPVLLEYIQSRGPIGRRTSVSEPLIGVLKAPPEVGVR